MWYYHATGRPCKFKSRHPISSGEQCPKCKGYFATVRHIRCRGCNTNYYTDDSYEKGDKFSCPINNEPVVHTSENVTSSASSSSFNGATANSIGIVKSTGYLLGTIVVLCVIY